MGRPESTSPLLKQYCRYFPEMQVKQREVQRRSSGAERVGLPHVVRSKSQKSNVIRRRRDILHAANGDRHNV